MPLIEDRYELLEVIASGGMATVWRAHDTRLDRLVAVKRPHPSPPGDDRSSDRMIREARAAAVSTHPNLLTIHDHGVDDEGPYLVMELAEGPTLQDAMGQLSAEEALAIGAQVADALSAIHDAGVIHRDVKPSNVILSERGPLLTDFGIALDPLATSQLTREGMVVATPMYAAPEVLAGETPTRASDVYSLAVVVQEVIDAGGGQVTSDLESVLAAAKSPRPEDRPETLAFAEALRGLAPTLDFTARSVRDGAPASSDPTLVMEVPPQAPDQPEEPKRGRLRAAPLLGGLLILLLAFALALALSGDDEPEPAVSTTIVSERTTVTTVQQATSTTTPPTTTTPAVDPVNEARARLEAILLEPPRSDLNARDVEKLMEDVDKAIDHVANGDTEKATDELEKVAEEIDEKVEGSNRERALEELSALAAALGVEFEMPETEDD